MTVLTSKLIIGVVGLAVLSSSITSGCLLTSRQTIRSKLEGEGYKIFDTTIVEENSDTSIHDYQSWIKKISNWSNIDFIRGKEKITTDSEKIKALKGMCKSVLSLRYYPDDANYKKAQENCGEKRDLKTKE